MIPFYIEENGVLKQVDMNTWIKWDETKPNRVVKESFLEGEKKIRLITVFFPVVEIDLEFDPKSEKPPEEIHYLYGTLVSGGRMDGHESKYRSRKEAEEGHETLMAQVKAVEAGGELPECCRT